MAKSQFNGEILHAVGVRYRVKGDGNLISLLHSLDEVRSQTLPTIAMASSTNREPTILANFEEQRIQLEIRTLVIDEVTSISKMIVFVKPVAIEYPG